MWFVLSSTGSFRSIQYSVLHSFNIQSKNELNPSPGLYTSILYAHCEGCTWLILNGLSKHPWSLFISVDHICRLFISWIISDSLSPPCTGRRAGHWSHIQIDKISILLSASVSPPGMEMSASAQCSHSYTRYSSLSQTLAIKLVICILRYWEIWYRRGACGAG